MYTNHKGTAVIIGALLICSPLSVFALTTYTSSVTVAPTKTAVTDAKTALIISLFENLIAILTQELNLLLAQKKGHTIPTQTTPTSLPSYGGGGGGYSSSPSVAPSGGGGSSAITVPTPANCTFNGQTVANGASVTAYQSSSVALGEQCVSEQRACSNGMLSGTYTDTMCTVQQISQVPGFTTSQLSRVPKQSITKGYAYQPSIIVDNGTTKAWFCGLDPNGLGDAIYYVPNVNENYSYPVIHARLNPNVENAAACAPSVIRHTEPDIEKGANLYLMYYECAADFAGNPGGYTQTCLAFSNDGVSWQTYNEQEWSKNYDFADLSTNPTPVLTVGSQVTANCNNTANLPHENSYSCNGGYTYYGVGHPSALVTSAGQIVLYFYNDSQGWSPNNVYVERSWDGFHFDSSTLKRTNLPNDATVSYYPGTVNGSQGMYIAITNINARYVYLYSHDGVNFEPTSSPIYGIPLTPNLSGLCASGGTPGIYTDSHGYLSSLTNVNILIGEGYRGSADDGSQFGCYSPLEDQSRGSTWKLYQLQGSFTF